MTSPVYIILGTSGIGGAEKRFFGLWEAMQRQGTRNVNLVCTPALYSKLQHNAEFAAALEIHAAKVIQADIQSTGFGGYREKVAAFVHDHVKKGSLLHFIGDHPLTRWKGIRQVYSITQSSLANLNMRGRLGQYGGVFFSDRTDVLDPGIAAHIRQLFFLKKGSISQTASSFCNTDVFHPEDKKDWIVFLGRFEPMKQVVSLVEALPAIHEGIRSLASDGLRYFILGHGSQEQELKVLLQQPEYHDIPVTLGYEQHPEEILNRSSVFLSLQLHNNYPSKSLLEAMAAGNVPVVTDVGETRWIARPEFSAFVPEKFTAQELTRALREAFSGSVEERRQKGLAARELVLREHTIDRMSSYYEDIYRQLSDKGQPCAA